MTLDEITNVQKQNITINQAVTFLQTHCTQSLKSIPLYRGTRTSAISIISPANRPARMSQTRSQLVINFASTSPSWSQYPPRDKSVCFSNDRDHVGDFGDVCRIFPIDGAKIAICPAVDFNYSQSFPNVSFISGAGFIGTKLSAVLHEIVAFAEEKYNLPQEQFANNSRSRADLERTQRLLAQCDISEEDLIKQAIRRLYGVDVMSKLESIRPIGNLVDLVDVILDPTSNGFKLTSIGELSSQVQDGKGHEFWTIVPCVVINEGVIEEVFELL